MDGELGLILLGVGVVVITFVWFVAEMYEWPHRRKKGRD